MSSFINGNEYCLKNKKKSASSADFFVVLFFVCLLFLCRGSRIKRQRLFFKRYFVYKVFVRGVIYFEYCFYRFKRNALVGLMNYHFAIAVHFRSERDAVGKLSRIRAAGGANRLALHVSRDFAICVHKHLNHLGIRIDFEAFGI